MPGASAFRDTEETAENAEHAKNKLLRGLRALCGSFFQEE
jgi:hypothetical protein